MKIKPDWHSWLQNYRKREIDIIFSHLQKKTFESGLELGAGDGFQSLLLANRIVRLIATDINPDRLKKQSYENITYRICDAEKLHDIFDEEQFDVVFSSNLLEHLPNPDIALKEIHGVMKKGAVSIHIIPNPFWKFCHLFFYIPNQYVVICETLIRKNGVQELIKKVHSVKGKEELRVNENNYKIPKTMRNILWRALFPDPHGISKSNIQEFYAFSCSRWRKEFNNSGLEVTDIIKGPVASGYGFGLDFLRHIFEKIGLTSEYIYICTKTR